MKLAYDGHGMQCKFVLMTIGDYRGGSVTPAPNATRNMSTRTSTRPEPARLQPPEASKERSAEMLPPLQPASRSFVRADAGQQQSRPSPPSPRASVDHESLFLPQDEDESLWGEPNYDDEQEDQLGWGAGGSNVRSFQTCKVSIVDYWNPELVYNRLAQKLDKSACSCKDTYQ